MLAPAGMRQSTFAQPLPEALQARAAAGHDAASRPIDGKARIHPEQAAAGLWSTATDVARFAIAVQQAMAGASGAALRVSTARTMLTSQWDRIGTTGLSAGLGVFLSGEGDAGRFVHAGINRGFRAQLLASRRPGWALVVLTNSDNGDTVFKPIEELVRAAFPQVAPAR